jgi:hypothetical protein
MNLAECSGLANAGDSLLGLIESWAYNILRFRAELELPPDTHEWWGLFDLLAAYHVRERIQALTEAGGGPPYAVLAADEVLRYSFTRTGFDWSKTSFSPGPGWWWKLMPDRGPVALEMNDFS